MTMKKNALLSILPYIKLDIERLNELILPQSEINRIIDERIDSLKNLGGNDINLIIENPMFQRFLADKIEQYPNTDLNFIAYLDKCLKDIQELTNFLNIKYKIILDQPNDDLFANTDYANNTPKPVTSTSPDNTNGSPQPLAKNFFITRVMYRDAFKKYQQSIIPSSATSNLETDVLSVDEKLLTEMNKMLGCNNSWFMNYVIKHGFYQKNSDGATISLHSNKTAQSFVASERVKDIISEMQKAQQIFPGRSKAYERIEWVACNLGIAIGTLTYWTKKLQIK
jgi:hypothetical protein